MLKNVMFVVIAVVILAGCSSSNPKQRLSGAGSFDRVAAAKTRVSLGLTYLQNGNFTQAKFNLDKALEFAPRSADAHYAMAYYYEQVEEIELAESAYQNALDYASNNPDILNSYGAFLCKQSKYEDAKTFFLRAVNSKNYISTAETYENLALCSQSQGLRKEAVEYFESALNHQPSRAQTLFLLAKLQAELEQFEAAKKNLWKFERNSAVTADSLFLSYQIANGLGDTKGALDYGELLKSMFANHSLTQRFTKEMGKFQPVATVTTKRTPSSSSSETVIPSPEIASSSKAKVTPEVESADTKNADYHVVKSKENLYRISLRYNVKMTRLMEWNELEDASSIRTGMKLWLKDPNKND